MTKKNKKQYGQRRQPVKVNQRLPLLNPHAAGIDVGASEHYVAVPVDRDEQPVRRFGAFTEELHALAQWLLQCGIKTVALESTGVYWIPLFQILESYGLAVQLVNARHVKNVPGARVMCRIVSGSSNWKALVCCAVASDQRPRSVCCAVTCDSGKC
jgi:hypothetical protein